MLTSNVVIWSPLLNFLVGSPYLPTPPPPIEAGCNWFELPLVVREQFFWRLAGYVLFSQRKFFELFQDLSCFLFRQHFCYDLMTAHSTDIWLFMQLQLNYVRDLISGS